MFISSSEQIFIPIVLTLGVKEWEINRCPTFQISAMRIATAPLPPLSRRERELLEIIYRLRKSTVSEVIDQMDDPPTRAAVRFLLRVMEEKGHIKHTKRGREFVYEATQARNSVGKSALHNVLHTFFDGSLQKGLGAYLADPKVQYDGDELAELARMIEEAKEGQSVQ
ncbi:MAG: putative transcriptional regulator [Verrucomicrobiales bacterium]